MEPDTFHVTEGCSSRSDKAHAKSGTASVMLMNVENDFVSPDSDIISFIVSLKRTRRQEFM